MSKTYPLPDYAVSVWVAGDNLMVAFPGLASEQGHTIKLPVSEAGLRTAIGIMKARSETTDLRLGNEGTPTQYDVEAGKAWGKVTRRLREEHEIEIADKLAQQEAERTAKVRARERAARELQELGL
jgi:hypothetical protein